jgi:VIT1/CCC1 family predicted Fe2+/Mn2+ transporter
MYVTHDTGALRAALFGFCDGLVSNCCLLIGVFASLEPNDSRLASTLLMTAVAGLTAGATSMAAGEWCACTPRPCYQRLGEERDA